MTKARPALHSDAVRHSIVMISMIILSFVIAVVVPLIVPEDSALRFGIVLIIPFAAFGLYGPLYLVLTHVAFRNLGGERLRSRLQKTGSAGLLTRFFLQGGGPKTWAIGIAVISLGAVAIMLINETLRSNGWLLSLGIVAITGSWVLLAAVFAVEYARAWAEDESFEFPGDEERTFFDFLYLSFQISTTFASSDVTVVSRRGRGMVTAQSIVAFAFNTVIVAVFVSMLLTITVG